MTTGKQLKVGSLCNIWLEQTEAWHGAIVTQDLGEGNYSAKLVEASDPYEIGQEIHYLHSRT